MAYCHCCKRLKYAEYAGKPKNVQDLEDFLFLFLKDFDKQGTLQQLGLQLGKVHLLSPLYCECLMFNKDIKYLNCLHLMKIR